MTVSTDIRLESEYVSNIASDDYPGVYWDEKDKFEKAFDMERFEKQFFLKISNANQTEIEFDIVGIDASMANAIRRILIAEVPTVAIEKVYIMNNTSVVQDEILAHRLGLVPIYVNPHQLDFKTAEEEPSEKNTIVFNLKVKYDLPKKSSKENKEPGSKGRNLNVCSSALTWVPQGNQAESFQNDPVRPVHGDILIAKLRPGQEIDLEAHCEKSNGKDHAKWSPVATASYRILPQITITKPITGEEAHKFAACFPPGVIGIETRKGGLATAVVLNARKDTVSRECLRHPEFLDKVILGRKRNHFIFTIESTGTLPPHTLMDDALNILIAKCTTLEEALNQLMI